MPSPALFPPPPRGIKGRAGELDVLARTIESTAPARLALVGAGGSGKSMLACALGHKMARRFGGRIDWFRVGAWDARTLLEMFALRFGLHVGHDREAMVQALRLALEAGGERLVVLDNHEDDAAMARFLDELAGTPVTWVITARRCLLAGVLVFPVTAPLVTAGRAAFPRVARLTRRLRWNPLALDIADAIVGSGAATVAELSDFLDEGGVGHVRVIDHEDDLPEVSLLVDWAWARLSSASKRLLGALSHLEGDHADLASLGALAGVRDPRSAIAPLEQWHLVQEPLASRYAVHAVVRYAVARRTEWQPQRAFDHYVALLEREPDRITIEQTHLFSAMDYANRKGDLAAMLRIETLLESYQVPAPISKMKRKLERELKPSVRRPRRTPAKE